MCKYQVHTLLSAFQYFSLAGGQNKNTMYFQFEAVLWKLVTRAGASTSGNTGSENCMLQDRTNIFQAATSMYTLFAKEQHFLTVSAVHNVFQLDSLLLHPVDFVSITFWCI